MTNAWSYFSGDDGAFLDLGGTGGRAVDGGGPMEATSTSGIDSDTE